MSFQADLEARYGTQLVIRFTNPDSKTATTANTTILDAALVFAKGRFRTYAGIVYDSTDDRMIDAACDIAIYKLSERFAERGQYKAQYDSAIQYLKDLRKVTNANRLVPTKKQGNSYVNIDTNATMADSRKLSRLGYPTLNDPPPALPRE